MKLRSNSVAGHEKSFSEFRLLTPISPLIHAGDGIDTLFFTRSQFCPCEIAIALSQEKMNQLPEKIYQSVLQNSESPTLRELALYCQRMIEQDPNLADFKVILKPSAIETRAIWFCISEKDSIIYLQ